MGSVDRRVEEPAGHLGVGHLEHPGLDPCLDPGGEHVLDPALALGELG
jgi:hypothetical protein